MAFFFVSFPASEDVLTSVSAYWDSVMGSAKCQARKMLIKMRRSVSQMKRRLSPKLRPVMDWRMTWCKEDERPILRPGESNC